jgi:hypothetical protein
LSELQAGRRSVGRAGRHGGHSIHSELASSNRHRHDNPWRQQQGGTSACRCHRSSSTSSGSSSTHLQKLYLVPQWPQREQHRLESMQTPIPTAPSPQNTAAGQVGAWVGEIT